MKESRFTQQNKTKWVDFERNLEIKKTDPRWLSKLFVQITDDLAYARTFYKNRSVRTYLNGVAQQLFNDIDQKRKFRIGSIFEFWKSTVPLAMHQARRPMLVAFLLFTACFTLGVVTSMHDPSFAKSILGADYVSMTQENIENNDPMAVYGSDTEIRTFTYIAFNNIMVMFRTFFSGVLFGIGAIIIIIYNGVMVGVFQYFFIEKGVFWESFLGIWTHGSLEIPSIIIAGGAGLALGGGLLFPGTHSRLQAFKMSARQGLIIMMGLAPVIMTAAFVEGFLTRHTELPDAMRLGFILLSFGFIFFYFVWYPKWYSKRVEEKEGYQDITLVEENNEPFDKTAIHSGGKLFSEMIRFTIRNMGRYLGISFFISVVVAIIVVTSPDDIFSGYYSQYNWLIRLLNLNEFPLLAALMGLALITGQFFSLQIIGKKLMKEERLGNMFWSNLLSSGMQVLVFLALNISGHGLISFLSFLVIPFFSLASLIGMLSNGSIVHGIKMFGAYVKNNWAKFLGMVLKQAGFGLVLMIVCSTFIERLVSPLVSFIWNDYETQQAWQDGTSITFACMFLLLYMGLVNVGNAILYYTLKETNTAEHLFKKIETLGGQND